MSPVAFLARCPDCGRFQVCVLDLDSKVNLKCRGCGAVFPSVDESPVSTPDAVNWSLAITLREYEFEPPRVGIQNLVVVQDLPSFYPRRKRRRRRVKKPRPVLVPIGPSDFEPLPAPEIAPVEPELPDVPEPAQLPTEEAAGDETNQQTSDEPLAVPEDVVSTCPSSAVLAPPRAVPRPKRKPKIEEEVEYGKLQLNAMSILALFLLVGGLLSASIEMLGRGFWPLIGLSLITGLVAIRSSSREGRRLLIPGAVTAIAAVAILGALIMPSMLGPGVSRNSAPAWANEVMVIPHPQFAGDVSLRAAEWVDGSKASVQQGLARIEVADVKIGRLRNLDEVDYMLIRIRIHRTPGMPGENDSGHRWDDKSPAVLRDSAGSTHQQVAAVMEQATANAADNSEGGVETVLVFPAAAGSNDGLRLEIPAGAWGGTATLKFSLPRSMIKR
jgi:hypothetical protein